MSVEEFSAEVKKWLAMAKHPRFDRLYTELTYQPMQEVLQYLRANGYKTYIVTGGGQDFVRECTGANLQHPGGTGRWHRGRNKVWLRKGWQAVPD